MNMVRTKCFSIAMPYHCPTITINLIFFLFNRAYLIASSSFSSIETSNTRLYPYLQQPFQRICLTTNLKGFYVGKTNEGKHCYYVCPENSQRLPEIPVRYLCCSPQYSMDFKTRICVLTRTIATSPNNSFGSSKSVSKYCRYGSIKAHPYNCQLYYRCLFNAKYVLMKCPNGLNFNPILKICDISSGCVKNRSVSIKSKQQIYSGQRKISTNQNRFNEKSSKFSKIAIEKETLKPNISEISIKKNSKSFNSHKSVPKKFFKKNQNQNLSKGTKSIRNKFDVKLTNRKKSSKKSQSTTSVPILTSYPTGNSSRDNNNNLDFTTTPATTNFKKLETNKPTFTTETITEETTKVERDYSTSDSSMHNENGRESTIPYDSMESSTIVELDTSTTPANIESIETTANLSLDQSEISTTSTTPIPLETETTNEAEYFETTIHPTTSTEDLLPIDEEDGETRKRNDLIFEEDSECYEPFSRYKDPEDCQCFYRCELDYRFTRNCCPDESYFNQLQFEPSINGTESATNEDSYCDIIENVDCKTIIQ
ncbi:hypothetical protein NH340_JMT00041 [Sarcoptes scabiei]|nr:hypothetical protein NH340_JMT00041 [Sarcoptes scabiei]